MMSLAVNNAMAVSKNHFTKDMALSPRIPGSPKGKGPLKAVH